MDGEIQFAIQLAIQFAIRMAIRMAGVLIRHPDGEWGPVDRVLIWNGLRGISE